MYCFQSLSYSWRVGGLLGWLRCCEALFCGPGIQSRRNKDAMQAGTSLKAIDRVVAGVQARINRRTMGGKSSAAEDFVRYVRAASPLHKHYQILTRPEALRNHLSQVLIP